MYYIYPKLSQIDMLFFRLGGAGLGNILFTYVEAVKYCSEHEECKLIWPTWKSLKIGPYLRRSLDNRDYSDLFENNSGYIDKKDKLKILLKNKKVYVDSLKEIEGKNGIVYVFTQKKLKFDNIIDDNELVLNNIKKNLNVKSLIYQGFSARDSICIHVRLGDFAKPKESALINGETNMSIPISWYVSVVKKLRSKLGSDTKVYIFSDGKNEELKELLEQPNCERLSFNTSIADILAMTTAGIFIASPSSFSNWVRYLGKMPSISYKNQMRERIIHNEDIEIEYDGEISEKFISYCKERMFCI